MIMYVAFACGRMNPPQIGHATLVDEVRRVANLRSGRARLFLTRSQDRQRNPLDPERKLAFARRFFPDVETLLVRHAFEAGEILARTGVTHATYVVGEDRAALGEQFAKAHKAMGLLRADFHLIPRPTGAPSATEARAAAQAGDLDGFARLTPSQDTSLIEELFHAVRRGLGEEWQ
jgi:hypothetical protein